MQEMRVDRSVSEFSSRFGTDLVLAGTAAIDKTLLADFNVSVYEDEFNASRYGSRDKVLRFWQWKYAENPAAAGGGNFGWTASYKDDIVGQFHLFPATAKIGDGIYNCVWGSDLAIAKSFRNLGLSAILVQKARDEVSGRFDAFLLGGMNENSYGVFRKSGFLDLGKIPRFIFLYDLGAIAELSGVPKWLARMVWDARTFIMGRARYSAFKDTALSLREIVSFGSEFDELWTDVSGKYKCIIKRDSSFLNWRFVRQPLWGYRILSVFRTGRPRGYTVLREGSVKNGRFKGLKIGIVSDLFVDPDDTSAALYLLAGIEDHFRLSGMALIKCDLLSERLEGILRSYGYMMTDSAHEFMLNIHGALESGADGRAASLRENWFIGSADTDFDFD